MPLSAPNPGRTLKHTRAIRIEAFARDDGLWDLDALITDIKTRDTKLASGVRLAGTPMHNLWLRVTIDTQLNIVDAEATSDAVPYPGDRCHALRSDGAAVAKYYPRWAIKAPGEPQSS